MVKNNINSLLEIKGFCSEKISQRLEVIKKKLSSSGIKISLNEERKLEKILNKIANNQASYEDMNFCSELCKFNNKEDFIIDEEDFRLSQKMKNDNRNIDNIELLRQSSNFNNLKNEIIKNTRIIPRNDGYLLTYNSNENYQERLSFRIKFNENKCIISFDENTLSDEFLNSKNNQKLFIEEMRIAMIQKLNNDFPSTYQQLILANDFVYFNHDNFNSTQQKLELNSINNIDILRFNAQLKKIFKLEIKDPKIINLLENQNKKLQQIKFFSYNFFKKIDSARKPYIHEVGVF